MPQERCSILSAVGFNAAVFTGMTRTGRPFSAGSKCVVLLGGKGAGNEWSASGALVGHRPAGSPAVGCSRGKDCARVESGAFPLTKH